MAQQGKIALSLCESRLGDEVDEGRRAGAGSEAGGPLGARRSTSSIVSCRGPERIHGDHTAADDVA